MRSHASRRGGSGCSSPITMSRFGMVPMSIPARRGLLDGQPIGRPSPESFRIQLAGLLVIPFSIPKKSIGPASWNLSNV